MKEEEVVEEEDESHDVSDKTPLRPPPLPHRVIQQLVDLPLLRRTSLHLLPIFPQLLPVLHVSVRLIGRQTEDTSQPKMAPPLSL